MAMLRAVNLFGRLAVFAAGFALPTATPGQTRYVPH